MIREAFRARGHEAWSIDLAPAEDGSQFHVRGDFFEVIADMDLDLLIAHPECRFLCNSGVLRLYKDGKKVNGKDEWRWQEMEKAAATFRRVWELPARKLCIENPVMHRYARNLIGGMRPTQTIQPFMFGDPFSKRTGLFLRGLPKLMPTNILPLPACGYWQNQTPSGQNKLGPSPERAMDRARTYPGPARAMAEQWG